MFVLGIDPGLTRCGYGVVERLSARRNRAVAAGVLRTDPADDIPVRLAELQAEVRGLLDEYRPDAVAIERVLFQVNVRTALQVGQAAGVVMIWPILRVAAKYGERYSSWLYAMHATSNSNSCR